MSMSDEAFQKLRQKLEQHLSTDVGWEKLTISVESETGKSVTLQMHSESGNWESTSDEDVASSESGGFEKGGFLPLQDKLKTEQKLDDRYESFGTFKDGGVGTIDIAMDNRLGRPVVLKRLTDREHESESAAAAHVAAFRREALLTAKLDHPNVVPVYDLGVFGEGQPILVVKKVEGLDLEDLLKGEPKEPTERHADAEFSRIMISVCDALSKAHANGIAHLDIKPANIMVGTDGEVYLIDWGGARKFKNISGQYTASYMAPEQASKSKIDGRTDIFLLGAVIYRFLTGAAPYDLLSREEKQKAAQVCEFPAIPAERLAGRAALGEIALRAMARNPEERFQTVHELKRSLRAFMLGDVESEVLTMAKGSQIAVLGEQATEAFLILEGRCQVLVGEGEARRIRGELGPGKTFGELALLLDTTRTATVEALTEVRLRRLPRVAFQRWLETKGPLIPFVQGLAERFLERSSELNLVDEENCILKAEILVATHSMGKEGIPAEGAERSAFVEKIKTESRAPQATIEEILRRWEKLLGENHS